MSSDLSDLLSGRRPVPLRRAAGWAAAGGAAYGAVMGSFDVPAGGSHWLQPAYAAVKVPLLLAVSGGLTLPAFAVVGALAGLRADVRRAVRAAAAAQAAMAVVLASLGPFAALWYASDRAYDDAVVFDGAMFAAALAAGAAVLRRAYRPLVAADPRHRLVLVA